MSFAPINPKPFLSSLLNQNIIVKLKFNNIEYRGKLVSFDNYMNLLLDYNTLEYDLNKSETEGVPVGNEIFIRCNNVLWIGEDLDREDEANNKKDVKMEE
ncbi:hypothetical protein PACTADRAFT_52110 [Pachysolen tannophilus NRRL Y-2460]|uniref:Sm protein F n=1 Tax=Pachysolen tannophilus NRRL Y-2460 TaxID=669874 RepID=A0A1E4TP61_PACTA|nr:hypothetical protein PACTADRAFT_52110 [Pachysolen tannophilus NRRL Y-2460]